MERAMCVSYPAYLSWVQCASAESEKAENGILKMDFYFLLLNQKISGYNKITPLLSYSATS